MNDPLQNFVHNMWNLYVLKGFAAKASWFSSIWKDNSATRMRTCTKYEPVPHNAYNLEYVKFFVLHFLFHYCFSLDIGDL